MFSTIKDICKFTFSIAKNTAELSGTVLDMVATNTFVKIEAIRYSSKRSAELEEKIKELHRILSTVSEELMMPFGGIELLKTKIIKFINNDIERINGKFNIHIGDISERIEGKFNINIGFIESLSLEEFTRTISNINTSNLYISEIEELFNELDSIELVSKTNKNRIELLLLFTRTTEFSINIKSNMGKKIMESMKSGKNELIELLSKDEVFNKILSQ